MNRKKSVSETALETVFSLYIRLRDSDSEGYGNCCTCGKRVHYSEADAGHFISRDRKATKYDEENVHLQCRGCNRFLGGRQYEHSLHIDNLYGSGTAEKILARSRQTVKRTKDDIADMRAMYKCAVDEMQKGE